MEAHHYEEKLWMAGSFTTIGAIVALCILGSVFSESKDEVIYGFGAMIVAVVVNILTNKLGYIRADRNAVVAAKKVEEVSVRAERAATTMIQIQEQATFTDERLENIARTGDKIHDLVNSNLGRALRALAESLRATANKSGLPLDIAAAKAAETNASEHDAKQHRVDTKAAALNHPSKGA